MNAFAKSFESDVWSASTGPSGGASKVSTSSSRKSRKGATPIQTKVKRVARRVEDVRVSQDQHYLMHITHRPIAAPMSTRNYDDAATRIQRRSQSRSRDALLTMVRGYAPTARVFVMTTTDGMRF